MTQAMGRGGMVRASEDKHGVPHAVRAALTKASLEQTLRSERDGAASADHVAEGRVPRTAAAGLVGRARLQGAGRTSVYTKS
jgi:hypothetical protein